MEDILVLSHNAQEQIRLISGLAKQMHIVLPRLASPSKVDGNYSNSFETYEAHGEGMDDIVRLEMLISNWVCDICGRQNPSGLTECTMCATKVTRNFFARTKSAIMNHFKCVACDAELLGSILTNPEDPVCREEHHLGLLRLNCQECGYEMLETCSGLKELSPEEQEDQMLFNNDEEEDNEDEGFPSDVPDFIMKGHYKETVADMLMAVFKEFKPHCPYGHMLKCSVSCPPSNSCDACQCSFHSGKMSLTCHKCNIVACGNCWSGLERHAFSKKQCINGKSDTENEKETPEGWECSVCTFWNSNEDSTSCLICGSARERENDTEAPRTYETPLLNTGSNQNGLVVGEAVAADTIQEAAIANMFPQSPEHIVKYSSGSSTYHDITSISKRPVLLSLVSACDTTRVGGRQKITRSLTLLKPARRDPTRLSRAPLPYAFPTVELWWESQCYGSCDDFDVVEISVHVNKSGSDKPHILHTQSFPNIGACMVALPPAKIVKEKTQGANVVFIWLQVKAGMLSVSTPTLTFSLETFINT